MRRLIIIAALIGLNTLGVANSLTENQQALSSIASRIDTLKKVLVTSTDKKKTLTTELGQLDGEIKAIQSLIDDLNQQLVTVKQQLSRIQAEERTLQATLLGEQTQLGNQIRAAYELGRHETLKLLLDQQNPNQITRMLTYYDYINRARSNMIMQTQTTLDSLIATKRNIQETENQIHHLNQSKMRHISQLEHTKAYQQHVLSELNSKIETQSHELVTLNKNKLALEQLIKQLQQRKTASIGSGHFKQMRHRLLWPAQGKLDNQAMGRESEQAFFNGLFIKANENTPVHAVFDGKVIFADWLRGYGLLMIVEHSDGYMSLYAHNNSLYYKTGQVVHAGDMIAKVGKSGGFSKSGLYFEIRHQGQPDNPRQWLKAIA